MQLVLKDKHFEDRYCHKLVYKLFIFHKLIITDPMLTNEINKDVIGASKINCRDL